MKTIKTISIILALFYYTNSAAQETNNDNILTVGTSVALLEGRLPSFNVSYDHFLTKRFSIGAGFTYNEFEMYNSNKSFRTNVGLRPLFHIKSNENIDVYTGGRIGISSWTGNRNYYDDFAFFPIIDNQKLPSIQILVGTRFMFTDWLGLNTELALGAPYLASAGISVNIDNCFNK